MKDKDYADYFVAVRADASLGEHQSWWTNAQQRVPTITFFLFHSGRILPANGISIPRPARTRSSRGVSARTNLPQSLPAVQLLNAENQYFSQTHDGDKVKQYAQRLISDEGKQNGLYWTVSAGQASEPARRGS